MMLAPLEKKRLRYSPLDIRFHLRDLIGTGHLKMVQTPTGMVVRVSKDWKARRHFFKFGSYDCKCSHSFLAWYIHKCFIKLTDIFYMFAKTYPKVSGSHILLAGLRSRGRNNRYIYRPETTPFKQFHKSGKRKKKNIRRRPCKMQDIMSVAWLDISDLICV